MRVRRSVPQKPLTEEQKARALEAQKNIQKVQWPLPATPQYQPSFSQTMMKNFQDRMRTNPFMRNRMTFEEKYASSSREYAEDQPIQINIEDTIVPPSLEEDANQASPLPPGVTNASTVEDLDEYIKKAQELSNKEKEQEPEVPIIETQNGELKEATINGLREMYKELPVKELKEIYYEKWWTRDIEHNNNKKNLINLIIDLIENGTQKETDWESTEW